MQINVDKYYSSSYYKLQFLLQHGVNFTKKFKCNMHICSLLAAKTSYKKLTEHLPWPPPSNGDDFLSTADHHKAYYRASRNLCHRYEPLLDLTFQVLLVLATLLRRESLKIKINGIHPANLYVISSK